MAKTRRTTAKRISAKKQAKRIADKKNDHTDEHRSCPWPIIAACCFYCCLCFYCLVVFPNPITLACMLTVILIIIELLMGRHRSGKVMERKAPEPDAPEPDAPEPDAPEGVPGMVNLTGAPITFVVAGSPPTQRTVKSHGIFRAKEEKVMIRVGEGVSVYRGLDRTYITSIEMDDNTPLLQQGVTVIVSSDNWFAAKHRTPALKQCTVIAPRRSDDQGITTDFL